MTTPFCPTRPQAPSVGRSPLGEPGTDLRAFPKITHVQLLDPEIYHADDLGPWPNDSMARGYHGIALLLKDARVLIAGGFSLDGPYAIMSERPDFRFYEPSYLHQGERPQWGDVQEPIAMSIGGEAIQIPYLVPEPQSGQKPGLKEKGGVVLMALGSFTHHFDHNQRYIPLDYKLSNGMLEITPPASASIAPPGDYILYLVKPSGIEYRSIRDFGIPSVGKHVVLN